MNVTIQKQSIKQDITALLVAIAITAAFIGYRSTIAPCYMPTSKIEEGTVVVRNDSIITVVIPDRR